MTDPTALATKLAALISEDDVFADGGARVISKGANPPAMVAILREVDDTVLERTLVFGLDNLNISLVIAGRRLRGIVAIDGEIAGMKDVIGQVLTGDEPDLLAAAGKVLDKAAANAQRVTVRSTPVRPIGDSSEKGMSAPGLAKAWDIDMNARPVPPMERFIASAEAEMTAHIYVVGTEVSGSKGKTEALQAIWDNQITTFRKNHKAVQSRPEGPMLVCLDEAITGKTGAALAMFGKESCLFSYKGDKLPQFISAWYAATT